MNQLLRKLLFLPPQSSTFAPISDRLHYSIFLAGILVGGVAFGAGLFWMIRYRDRGQATTPRIEGNVWTESAIVGIPLAVFLLWFVIGYHDYLYATTPPKGALDVYVSAKQWMWKFTYPEGPSSIGTLRVPLGKPVRLLLTSRDVVHSFYVPDFRVKQDAVPDRYTQLWFQATQLGPHPIECAEYCGLSHSMMDGTVEVMDPADYQRWIASQSAGMADRADGTPPGAHPGSTLRVLGQEVAERQGCLKCHSLDGSAHIGPTWLDLYGRKETLTTGEQVVADDAYLTQSMMDPKAKVVRGFDPVMPSFQGQLTPEDTAALLEFIRSLRTQRLGETPSKEPVYAPRH
jgi:cytochrome c oxidase subunit 2